jgi:hypothetical protein
MSDWQLVHDSIRDSDIAGAITTLETFIANHDSQRFSCLLRESFSNSPSTVLADVNRFIRANDKQFDVKAVYLEMNGFEINYDEWFFNPFAYSSYSSDFDDMEWSSDWQSPDWPQITLFGMESSQEAFAWYHEQRIWESQRDFKPIYEASLLLIAVRFMAFVGTVIKSNLQTIPVLATHRF